MTNLGDRCSVDLPPINRVGCFAQKGEMRGKLDVEFYVSCPESDVAS